MFIAIGCGALLCAGIGVGALLLALLVPFKADIGSLLSPPTSAAQALTPTPTLGSSATPTAPATSSLVNTATATLETSTPTSENTPTPSGTAPNPTESPTPELSPTVLAWDANFKTGCDLFEGDNDIRKYGCANGEYTMLHKQATTRYAYYDTIYDDEVIQAEGHFVSGTGAYEYGIVFRANTDGTLYYLFTVTQDGKYTVSLYQNSKYTDLIPPTASPIVKTGSDHNRFRVVAYYGTFDFYLNGQSVGHVEEPTITQGRTGFFLYNAQPNLQVAFDQLTVWTFPQPTPNVTPTPKPTDQPTYLSWNANFTSGCDLFVGENDVRKYGCENGAYTMLHKQATTRYAYYNVAYDDSVIFAQGHWVSGDPAYEYGIIFRANADGTLYYTFTVTADGKYNVALFKDNQYTNLIPYTTSPLVHTGATPNRFQVVAHGSRLFFYLNDEYLTEVDDATIARGYTGLFFYNQHPNAQVAFDALTVWTFTPTTPSANGTAPAPTRSPATPTRSAIASGVYVNSLRLSPGAPKRGQPVTFLASFLNSTGNAQGYHWFVEIWQQNPDKRFGQDDGLQRNIPLGTNELATAGIWKLSGGGPCQPFRARVVYEDNQASRIPFKRTNGTDLWVNFQVCP
jgi:hypothetical protein